MNKQTQTGTITLCFDLLDWNQLIEDQVWADLNEEVSYLDGLDTVIDSVTNTSTEIIVDIQYTATYTPQEEEDTDPEVHPEDELTAAIIKATGAAESDSQTMARLIMKNFA